MKVRNAHSSALNLPGGLLAPGGCAEVDDSFRDHAWLKAGVLVEVKPEPKQPESKPRGK